MFNNTFNRKGLTHYLVVLQELHAGHFGAQQGSKLTVVQLANDYFLVAAYYLGGILGQRVDVVEVCECAVQLVGSSMQVTFG